MVNKVKLITCEGEEVEIDIDVAEKSEFIKDLIDDSPDKQISLNVKRPILEKVIDFCRYLKDH